MGRTGRAGAGGSGSAGGVAVAGGGTGSSTPGSTMLEPEGADGCVSLAAGGTTTELGAADGCGGGGWLAPQPAKGLLATRPAKATIASANRDRLEPRRGLMHSQLPELESKGNRRSSGGWPVTRRGEAHAAEQPTHEGLLRQDGGGTRARRAALSAHRFSTRHELAATKKNSRQS